MTEPDKESPQPPTDKCPKCGSDDRRYGFMPCTYGNKHSWHDSSVAAEESPSAPPSQEECGQRERDADLLRMVDDPSIVYYGPHACPNGCGVKVCRASSEQGGMMFFYPEGIIYPNTNWVQHVCPSGEWGGGTRIDLGSDTTAGCEICKTQTRVYYQCMGVHFCPACYEKRNQAESPSAPQPPRPFHVIRQVLKEHWLNSVECLHIIRSDVSHCACGWKSGIQPTVGLAVDMWITHVFEQADKLLTPKPANEAPETK